MPPPGARAILLKAGWPANDLDPLSVAELRERIALLEAEIERVGRSTARIAPLTIRQAQADQLFKREKSLS